MQAWTIRRVPSVFFVKNGAAGVLFAATSAAAVGMEVFDVHTKRQASDRVDDRGTGPIFALAMLVAIAGSMAVAFGFPRSRLPGGWPPFAIGLALIWAGLGLNRWSRWALGPAYRPVVTIIEDQQVVMRGPYRALRHPMYAGGILMCLGVGLLTGTWIGLALWLLPPAALVRRIHVEEEVLGENLGETYVTFRDSRSRLIPRIW